MDYPLKLLPQKNYKYISLDTLDKNALLLRTTESNDRDFILDTLDKVNPEAILPFDKFHQVFGLSVNLFGIYDSDDICFRVLSKELNEYWNEGDVVSENISPSDYQILENRGIIFFEIFKLQEKSFPYKNPKDNPEEFIGLCKIFHKPTKANFWHYQIEFEDKEGKIIKSKGSAWQKNMSEYLVRSFLKKYAFYEEKTILPQIEEGIYTIQSKKVIEIEN